MKTTDTLSGCWQRLQALSCAHAAKIGPQYGLPINRRSRKPFVNVPEVIRENVEILGSCDEESIKHRIHWYITFHPDIFDACSKAGWTL